MYRVVITTANKRKVFQVKKDDAVVFSVGNLRVALELCKSLQVSGQDTSEPQSS